MDTFEKSTYFDKKNEGNGCLDFFKITFANIFILA